MYSITCGGPSCTCRDGFEGLIDCRGGERVAKGAGAVSNVGDSTGIVYLSLYGKCKTLVSFFCVMVNE